MSSFKSLRKALLMGVATLGTAAAVSTIEQPAFAQEVTRTYNIQAQDLNSALREFALQTGRDVLYPPEIVAGKRSNGAQGQLTERQALDALLAGTGLRFEQTASNGYAVQDPNSPTQLGDAGGAVPSEAEEEIVVVGTHLRGVHPASPVISIDRDAIEASGYGNVSQLVASLPQNYTGTVNSVGLDVGGGGLSAGSGADIRGLGIGTTLVLLDGQRAAPAGLGQFVNLSALPLSAIERVDVLTDGASAIYGSDAVGGVINYVLRRDFDGAETALRYGSVTSGSLEEIRASQLFGRTWQGGNLIASYEFYRQTNLPVADRDFVDASLIGGDLIPDQERNSLFLSLNQRLTEALELSGAALCGRRETDQATMRAGSPAPGQVDSREDQCSAFGDLSIALPADWELTLGGSYGDYARRTRLTVFSQIPGPGGTPILVPSTRVTETDSNVWSLDAKLDGSLFDLPGGAVRTAIGVDYRAEDLSQEDVTNAAVTPTSSRDVTAAYGEVLFPFVSEQNASPGLARFELTLAGRYENYSDFGETTNPKVGLLYSPAEGLNFRATYGTSFRAPFLYEAQGSFTGSVFDVSAFGLPNPFDPGARGPLVVFLFGDPAALEPETATTWTAGVDFAPRSLPGLDASLTYYNIDYRDRIADPLQGINVFADPLLVSSLLLANPSDPTLTALFADLVARNSFFNFSGVDPADPANYGQIAGIIDGRNRNIGSVTSDGLDLTVNYDWTTSLGDFGFVFNATYVFQNERQILPTTPTIDILDRPGGPLDLRARTGLTWRRDAASAAVFINYADTYTNTDVATHPLVASFTTVDTHLQYALGDGDRPLIFSLSVQNLFDEEPPQLAFDGAPGQFFFSRIGFDPSNADPTGRFIAFEVTKRW